MTGTKHGQLIPKNKPDFNPISSLSISSNYSFKTKEGDLVLLHELRCEVISHDYSSGKVLVTHEYWGSRWCEEREFILLKDIFSISLIQSIVKFITSKSFAQVLGVQKSDKEIDEMLKMAKNENKLENQKS